MTIGLYDWSGAINALGSPALAILPIAGMQEHIPDVVYSDGCLYFSTHTCAWASLCYTGHWWPGFFISILNNEAVSDRENLIGTVVFFYGSNLCRRNHLFELRRDVLHQYSLQDEHEFRAGANRGVAGLLRSPLQKYWLACAGITPRSALGRRKLFIPSSTMSYWKSPSN